MAASSATEITDGEPRGSARAALLSAASALMTEGDTLEVSLSEIAQRAGVNSALVKYYFGSKRGLMLALVERDAVIAIDQLDGLIAMDLSPLKKLRIHLAGMINAYFSYPYLNRLISTLIRESSAEEADEIAKRYLRPIAAAQATLIDQGVKAGAFRPVDPMMFYFVAAGACDEIFAARQIRKHVFGIDTVDTTQKNAFISKITNIICSGILTEPLD